MWATDQRDRVWRIGRQSGPDRRGGWGVGSCSLSGEDVLLRIDCGQRRFSTYTRRNNQYRVVLEASPDVPRPNRRDGRVARAGGLWSGKYRDRQPAKLAQPPQDGAGKRRRWHFRGIATVTSRPDVLGDPVRSLPPPRSDRHAEGAHRFGDTRFRAVRAVRPRSAFRTHHRSVLGRRGEFQRSLSGETWLIGRQIVSHQHRLGMLLRERRHTPRSSRPCVGRPSARCLRSASRIDSRLGQGAESSCEGIVRRTRFMMVDSPSRAGVIKGLANTRARDREAGACWALRPS